MSLAALARPTLPLSLAAGAPHAQSGAAVAARMPTGLGAPLSVGSPGRADGFDNLVKYIPTETVTIFVAVCSARSAVESVAGDFSFGLAYIACAALTPALLWLIAAGRHRAAGGTGPVPLHWWPLVAATVAFLFWALSVPGVTEVLSSEPTKQAAWGVLAGVAAVLVSLVLSLLEPVLGPRPAATPQKT